MAKKKTKDLLRNLLINPFNQEIIYPGYLFDFIYE